jgi:3-oxoacyl-[acyl-carrier protein] reductase
MSDGPVTIVSGGSRGLGLEIARHLLARGGRVATFARTAMPELEPGDRVLARRLDATATENVAAFVSETVERFGRIDALVNNAAVGQDSLFVHTAPERIDEILRTNLAAPMLLTRAVVRQMLRLGTKGRVVNITSISAARGYPGLAVYSAAKGALESFTRSLARELEGRVMVNAIAPGFFPSEMSSSLRPEDVESIVRRTPTGELTTAASVLPVLGLLLEADTNVNGQVIPVDGGATA